MNRERRVRSLRCKSGCAWADCSVVNFVRTSVPQLGVIGWSEDRSEFVVRGVGFTSDQVSRIKAGRATVGLDVPVRVVETALVTSDQRRLSDLIREQVLHALPPEVGWTIGIDLDSQRIDVGVDGYGDLAELDRAIRSVVEDFLKTLVLQRGGYQRSYP